jgi:hypothetical protein
LVCLCLMSCVPNVASFSGLSIPNYPFHFLKRLFTCDDKCTFLVIRHENHYFISGNMDNDIPQCKSTTSKNNDLKNHRYNNGMPLNVSYLKRS